MYRSYTFSPAFSSIEPVACTFLLPGGQIANGHRGRECTITFSHVSCANRTIVNQPCQQLNTRFATSCLLSRRNPQNYTKYIITCLENRCTNCCRYNYYDRAKLSSSNRNRHATYCNVILSSTSN